MARITIYHGTSDLYKDKILQQGLLSEGSSDGVVNVTTDIDYAREQAEYMADWDGAGELLLSIEVDEEELTPNRRGGDYATYCFEMADIAPQRLIIVKEIAIKEESLTI